MSSTRFFSFGCSVTKYGWPTWADILGTTFDEHQNWGVSGAGNQFIHNSIIECHLKNQISESDVVGVMWTNVSRLDTYKNRKWLTPGNIYTQEYYPKEFVDLISDTRGFYLRDLCLIYSADQLLKKIGCKYYMMSMVDILNHDQFEQNNAYYQISDMLPYFKESLDKIKPSIHKVVFNNDWWSRPFLNEIKHPVLKEHYETLKGVDWPDFDDLFKPDILKKLDRRIVKEIFNLNKWNWKNVFRRNQRIDTHPTPLEHLEYLDKVLPDHPISTRTRQLITIIDELLRKNKKIDPFLLEEVYSTKKNFKRW